MSKSLNTIIAELRTFLEAYNRGIDTSDNSLVKDIILLPLSIGGKEIMDQVEIARDLGILSRLTGGDLDNEGTNYKLEKLPGSYATVTLTFYANTKPTSDIIIPANIQVSTIGTSFVSPVRYNTISETRFSIANIDSYYSYDRDRYEFSVEAICTEVGEIGNTAINTIIQLLGSIGGIDGVTNLIAATGGQDEESEDDFRTRIQLAKTGRDLNTVNGLKLYLRSLGFIDTYPVRVEDGDSERTGIDVFVVTSSIASYTETFTFSTAQEKYYLTKRPVVGVTSVVGSSAGTLGSSDFDTNIDNSSPMRRSVYAQDYIRIRKTASLVNGEELTVTYNYSPLIINTQSTLDENTNDVLTADPLLKRAFPLYLYMNAGLTLKANADGPATRNKCKNALIQYLSNYRLGDDLQKSDMIVVLQQGYGDYPITMVDSVVINSYYLQDELGNVYQPVNEIISVSSKQYIVYGSITLV